MELRRIRYFVAAAEHNNIGRAARQLNISQPPLSRQIQLLEEELGVVLFERSAVGVDLTPAGETFYAGARDVLQQIDKLCQRTQRIAKGEIGTISVGFRETMMYSGVVPAIFHDFRSQYPEINLELNPLRSRDQWDALKAGKIDAGFVHTLSERESGLSSELVFEDNFIIAVNESNPLASKQLVRLKDLEKQPFIWFPRSASPRYHDELLSACVAAGFTPKVVQLLPYVGGIAITLVSAGVGISFAQEASADLMRPPNVVLKRVSDLDVKVRCSLIWKTSNQSKILESFLSVARRVRKNRL